MNYRDEISIGTAQFGYHYGVGNTTGMLSDEEVSLIISDSSAASIHTLDTAPEYGIAELRLGRCDLSSFHVGTKLPALPGGDLRIEYLVESSIQKSLTRLNIPRVYSYLVHRPSDLYGDSGAFLYKILQKLKERGICEKIGVSVYTEDEAQFILKRFKVDVVQTPYNVVDRRFDKSGLFRRMKESGVEVHVRSVFLQGLLFMDKEKMHPYFSKWSQLWEKFEQWKIESERGAFELCLGFALQNEFIDKIVIGIDNRNHFEQLVGFLDRPIEELEAPMELSIEDRSLIIPSLWFSES